MRTSIQKEKALKKYNELSKIGIYFVEIVFHSELKKNHVYFDVPILERAVLFTYKKISDDGRTISFKPIDENKALSVGYCLDTEGFFSFPFLETGMFFTLKK